MDKWLIFLVQIGIIYFLNRATVNEIYFLLNLIFKNKLVAFSIISLLFLPGTILHELSHYFIALVLFLNVREVSIFPRWQGNTLKLGRVIYEKTDPIRGFIVGVAPLFGAMLFFLLLALTNIFPTNNLIINLLLIYVIIAVSSTMFSSAQDLIDLISLIPFLIIILTLYFLNIRINLTINYQKIINSITNLISQINIYLTYSILLNGSLYIGIRSLRKITKR